MSLTVDKDVTCKVLESRRSVCALLPTAYLTNEKLWSTENEDIDLSSYSSRLELNSSCTSSAIPDLLFISYHMGTKSG